MERIEQVENPHPQLDVLQYSDLANALTLFLREINSTEFMRAMRDPDEKDENTSRYLLSMQKLLTMHANSLPPDHHADFLELYPHLFQCFEVFKVKQDGSVEMYVGQDSQTLPIVDPDV